MKICQPITLRRLAGDRDTWTLNESRGAKRSQWSLDIAGPFCVYPKSSLHSRAEKIASQISNLLALPARCVQNGNVLAVYVMLTDEEWQRIFETEYRKTTRARC